jgi:hypothetical protein
LERWESDRFLVIIYHDGQLTAQQDSGIGELAQRSSAAGGPLNIEVIRFDVSLTSPPKLLDLQPPPADKPLPWIEVRSRIDATRTALRWSGPLADAIGEPGLFESPGRAEIVRRILNGDSCVWLLVAPEEQLQRSSEQLQSLLDSVGKGLKLPQGIGLPGSELYAQIPLEIRFSVVPLSHSDPKEHHFMKLLAASFPEWNSETAYVIPIFGRCRALEVFTWTEPDEPLIRDVGEFLCAACSCRVKQANPGFDLLASINWNERLFSGLVPELKDGDSQPSRPAGSNSLLDSTEYLSIPAGNATVSTPPLVAMTVESREAPIETGPEATQRLPGVPINALLMLLAIIAIVGGGILAGVTRTRS